MRLIAPVEGSGEGYTERAEDSVVVHAAFGASVAGGPGGGTTSQREEIKTQIEFLWTFQHKKRFTHHRKVIVGVAFCRRITTTKKDLPPSLQLFFPPALCRPQVARNVGRSLIHQQQHYGSQRNRDDLLGQQGE